MSSLFGETPQPQNTTNSAAATANANTQQAGEKPQTASSTPSYADQLRSIVTPDGRQKYADVETALNSIPHAQAKIEELQAQLRRYEDEATMQRGRDEVLQHLQSSKPAPEQPSASKGLDEKAVANILQNQLAQMEQAKARTANAAQVRDSLAGKYGDKAEEMFGSRAKELGVTPEFFAELAHTQPQLVLAYFNDTPRPSGQPVQGTINTGTVKPSAPERKPVMRGASTKDVLEQFRAHRPN